MVIFMPPRLNEDLRFGERVEALAVQAFIAQAAIKPLVEPIFPRAARFDIGCFYSQAVQPLSQRRGRELAAIVATDIIGQTMGDE